MPSNEDTSLCAKYFDDIAKDAAVCTKFVENMTERIKNGDLVMKNGNSLLHLRNQLLLDYLVNLTKLVKCKSNGEKIENNPIVDRLIELRVYIEKGQTIYNKMSYQIEKVISLGKNTSNKQDNPLKYRPKPENLIDIDDEEDQSDEEDDEEEFNKPSTSQKINSRNKGAKSNIYIAPKVSSMMYDEDETSESTKKKALEKAKKRALSSSIIQELKREYDEGPEEITTGSIRKRRLDKKLNKIKEYEEENFTRVNLTKKDKQAFKRSFMTTSSLTDDITKFGDTSFLTMDEKDSILPGAKSKKSKPQYKSSKGKKGKGKRKKLR